MDDYIKYINIPVNKILIDHYATIGLDEKMTMLLIRLMSYSNDGLTEVTFDEIIDGSTFTREELSKLIQHLIANQFIGINNKVVSGKHVETYDFNPLYKKLENIITNKATHTYTENDVSNLFQYIEKLYGRTLGPSEYERMTAWLRDDGYSVDEIKEGIDMAYKNDITSLSYVEKILNSIKKQSNDEPVIPFKNWLKGDI